MELRTLCPLSTSSVIWRSARGLPLVTIVARATFELRPGEARLAPTQEPVQETDSYWDDDFSRSLHAASDLAPFKARADVIVVGHAYAPGGKPARRTIARVAVGGVDKAIEVWCPRKQSLNGQITEGAPFTKMPLRWERASGGNKTSNPVGVDAADRDGLGASWLPNLEPIGGDPGDTPRPAVGFGPIAPMWPSRRNRGGPILEGWMAGRWWADSFPEGVDASFFNVAPADQQAAMLRDYEPIILEGLHPEHERLVTRLPGVRPLVVLDPAKSSGEVRVVGMVADTLWIDTDRSIACVTWRGQVSLDGARDMRAIVAMESHDHRLEPGRVLELNRQAPALSWDTQVRTAEQSTDASPLWLPARTDARPRATMVIDSPAAEPAWNRVAAANGAAANEASTASGSVAPRFSASAVVPRAHRRTEPTMLLWFDRSAASRICGDPRLCDRADGAVDDKLMDALKIVTNDRAARDEASVRRVLVEARPTDVADLPRLLTESVDERGNLFAPLVLVEADMKVVFSDAERLRALVAAAGPFSTGDKRLTYAVNAARDVLNCTPIPSQVLDASARRIEDAFGAVTRSVAADYLESSTRELLLESRAYQRRSVLGETNVRLSMSSAGTSVPLYLREPAAALLPLFTTMRAAVIAEVLPTQDAREPSSLCLRALAVARVVSLAARSAERVVPCERLSAS